jgi:Ser/Thr protein kinase RdoA (MazF antagonist)
MMVSEISALVYEYFNDNASQWKLQPEALRVEYVTSPGGFGPMNFTVHDGATFYHVKLNRSRDELATWSRASARLAEMYRAPRLLAQVETGGRYGAIFERLPGEPPVDRITSPVLDGVVAMMDRLHQDRGLATLIGQRASPARNTLFEYHLHMCERDLEDIEPALPLPFVDNAALAWMHAETDALREHALRSAAFDEEVDNPIHGDLWYGNVLVDGDRWWIIDWDDLKIGDPAHDLSLISFTELDGAAQSCPWLDSRDRAFMERFSLYLRAALLTFVIDPLADWVEAEAFPDVRDAARTHRENLHRWALARYRRLYE